MIKSTSIGKQIMDDTSDKNYLKIIESMIEERTRRQQLIIELETANDEDLFSIIEEIKTNQLIDY